MPDNPLSTKTRQDFQQLARQHYENFPVASWLLPKSLRGAVAVIYAFARSADDFADEGDYSVEERLAMLQDYRDKLMSIGDGVRPQDPMFQEIHTLVHAQKLPLSLFDDLVSAFMQDVTKKRYADFAEVLDYCRRSANPVGRLLLHLFNEASDENLRYSDNICTALQLINFLQDIAQDFFENDRIYFPEDEMVSFGVSVQHIQTQTVDRNMKQLFLYQLDRAEKLLSDGAPLGRKLSGRIGLEIRVIIAGGLRIISKLRRQADRVFDRPRLNPGDKFWMLNQAVLKTEIYQ